MKDLIKYVMPLAILMVIIFAITNLIEFRFGGLGVGLLIGIIAGYYFNVDNPHNDYKKHITVLLFVWVISIHLSREFNTGTWLPALLSGSLAYYYFLRTRARAEILWVDYLKLIGVILIVPSVYFQSGILAIVALYLGFIFSLDRIVIRRQMNKTTQIITFSIMALMSLSFIIYAFIKADEAEKAMSAHRFASERFENEAEKLRGEAVELQNKAQEMAAEAKRLEAESLYLRDALESCKNK